MEPKRRGMIEKLREGGKAVVRAAGNFAREELSHLKKGRLAVEKEVAMATQDPLAAPARPKRRRIRSKSRRRRA